MTTTVSTPDGDMPAYVAGDAASARAAVVVIQEAFGVTAHIERCFGESEPPNKKRHDDSEGGNQLRHGIECFPGHPPF